MSSSLPVLAPRLPGCPPPVDDRTYTKEHSEDEWESMREIIKKLYIKDNRKLNETMAILQARYGFAATEQMFKKRLKKWNLRKRTYRKGQTNFTAPTPVTEVDAEGDADADADVEMEMETRAVTEETETPIEYCGASTVDDQGSSSSSTSPEELPDQDDTNMAMALVQPSNTGPYANLEQILGSVFNWSQSKLEFLPSISDPMSAYLANPNSPPIQDSRTMYRIFELVFDLWYHGKGDLAGMAARRGFYVLEFVLSEDHPDLIWHVLDTIFDMVDRGHLQLLGLFLDHATVLAKRQLPAQHPLLLILQQLRDCDYHSDEGRSYLCHLLRQAWLRNVDLLGQHIETSDAHRLWLYEQLIWDGRTRLRKGSDLRKRQEAMYQALERLSQAQTQTSNAIDADRLRVEALRLEFTQMDVGDKVKAEELATNLLDITRSDTGPRSNDRFHAYACKMLARVQEEKSDWTMAERNLQHAISKRESAHGGDNNLRVIRDMWVLAAHYQKAGRLDDANAITNDALSRAQKFLSQGME
ncbi:clr5 protein [Fusarium flagelliforme]|uniref:Clr5 protein n=1 Tax=Fusarium flagelliforme TaxID=2675880 RepID=A0A395N4F1_9HYPO|nr:clr5 protein [Fusarium flagelliforme]